MEEKYPTFHPTKPHYMTKNNVLVCGVFVMSLKKSQSYIWKSSLHLSVCNNASCSYRRLRASILGSKTSRCPASTRDENVM